LKVTSIDPFSIREQPQKVPAIKEKVAVEPTTEAQTDQIKREDNRLVDIIEEAQKRSKKRQGLTERRRRRALVNYTKVGFIERDLQERGNKLDTRA